MSRDPDDNRGMVRGLFGTLRRHGVDAKPPPHRTWKYEGTDFKAMYAAREMPGAGSATTLHIVYNDMLGQPSERTISVRRIDRNVDGTLLLHAHCHMRNAMRCFRADRITDTADAATGEIVDIGTVLRELVQRQVTCAEDLVLILVFLARCDRHEHQNEIEAIEAAIVGHALRYGGDDASVSAALARIPRIAPRGPDFLGALKRMVRHPDGSRMARFVLDHGGSVVAADGVVHRSEVQWGGLVDDVLKRIATAR